MRIAVASQNYRTVTPHASMTRRFLVYEAEPDGSPREVDRLDLPKELAIREFAGRAPHPLDDVDVVIVGSAGPGFVSRMAERGVEAVVTSETDPLKAIRDYLAESPASAEPHIQDSGANSDNCYGVRLRLERRARRRDGHWRLGESPSA